LKAVIKKMLLSIGADVCGVANIDRFCESPEGFSPIDVYKNCNSVITFGIALPIGLSQVDPRIIYGHYNELSCIEADRIAFISAKEIERRFNCVAVPLPCDSPYEYWDSDNLTGRGLISMKHAAILSGLGALGKNTLLINPQYGNLLTIGAILTDLELESDDLSGEICIRGCTRCIDNCPTHAIKDGTVNQRLCRNYTYGKTERGFSTVNCNICRNVCPLKSGLKTT